MILGEYEQRAVYKRYNIVDNGSDIVLGISGAIYRVNHQIQLFFFCGHVYHMDNIHHIVTVFHAELSPSVASHAG